MTGEAVRHHRHEGWNRVRRRHHAPTWRGEAHSTGRRYPLGVAGAVILLVFVFAARSSPAPSRRSIRSPPTRARASRRRASAHLFGADAMGRDLLSRMIHGARISLAVSLGATILGSGLGTIDRPRLRLHRRLVRPHRAAPDRDHAGPAAAGHGAGDHRLARPVADQHHRRHRHPADPQRRARHPLQRAVAARTAVRRGRARPSA